MYVIVQDNPQPVPEERRIKLLDSRLPVDFTIEIKGIQAIGIVSKPVRINYVVGDVYLRLKYPNLDGKRT